MAITSKKIGSNGSECLDGGDKDILLSLKENYWVLVFASVNEMSAECLKITNTQQKEIKK
ncbi:hypothetical protein HB976_07660 [Yersinia mollaretii]|uniref:hypothetical protein n=1 Tax=Yersinia mollaretii TaxID=33060 RepID=UPI001427C4B7|nr:hypothetical protein [Yersinia mollaretii]MDA5526709.1 hypothetical protein [Yersinia mollaretii]MDA5534915.1 hypothetical protein [Yersinia mollaretii]MDR7873500.1 hypothetical protein [Yersinia mollaretii]NIL02832.1 hypothetical protein [Yersinia mollaretii]WQC77167.1 hypothetical protein U1Z61_09120 [Yersinia mollaretii]